MLNLVKWDFINFAKKYGWLYISYAIVLVSAIVFRAGFARPFSEIGEGICAVYSLFFYGYTLFVSAAVTISWLRMDTAQLELSLPVQSEKLLLCKLILSITINASGWFLFQRLWSAIHRFGMANIVLMKNFSGFLVYLSGITVLTIIIMFSYITAKSFRFTRNKARITTVLLVIAICTLSVRLLLLLFSTFGFWNVSITNHDNILILPNEKLKGLTTICYIISVVGIMLAGFFGSSALFKRRFERY